MASHSNFVPALTERVAAAFGRVMPAVAFRQELRQVECKEWTSLRHVQLMVQLEKDFGLRFDGGVISRLTSVPTIVAELELRLAAATKAKP